MACSGGHCTLHNAAFGAVWGCSGHRGVCTSNNAYSFPSGATRGGIIRASDVQSLRTKIQQEITKFRAHAHYSAANTSSIDRNTYITVSETRTLPDAIDDLSPKIDQYTAQAANTVSVADNRPRSADDPSGGGNAYVRNWATSKRGNAITRQHFVDIYNMYHSIRRDCICNTDCDCNAVCNCHNNCGCHY